MGKKKKKTPSENVKDTWNNSLLKKINDMG